MRNKKLGFGRIPGTDEDSLSALNTRPVDVSFCIAARNRKEVIERTLAFNLRQLEGFDNARISLVDYGSKDDLSLFVWDNFAHYIKTGKLLFFEVKNQVNWSAPRAKNLAHRIANAHYLFNLDADNFIVKEDVNLILAASKRQLPSHQFSGDWDDGTYGRIGLSSKRFFEIGGYDESMLPMGCQDMDLILRSCSQNHMLIYRLPIHNHFKKPIANSKKSSLSDFDVIRKMDVGSSKKAWKQMNSVNALRARMRWRLEGPEISGGFSSYYGFLNGIEVSIDGFDSIRAAEDKGLQRRYIKYSNR